MPEPLPASEPPPHVQVGRRAEFYVGYLKTPPGLARFFWRLAPTLLLVLTGLAWILGRAQNDPGEGVWDSGTAREFVGRVDAHPYPHIRILTGEPHRPVETLLLVEVGKFGGQRAAPLAGRAARISGWVLERGGRRMLELEPGDSLRAVESAPESPAGPGAPRVVVLGTVTLRGEIVDSKCYLGAMKPGEGKTHKECATLCIAGGIPPMFVTLDAAGRRRYYLLADPQGLALDSRILPYVADPIEVTGALEMRDDVYLLRIDPSSIRRL